ncbi:16S rRNA (cytidine(1402)-2'-O)-methyltransferase [Pseudodesulfovibrio sp. JC047]|uniref:16S rRNA (cytidine(1402)-2'-O)-methyltransferase n=1 Tax=Pseudodesulfovibrio sp. JC047 TaxID=2683199 RepID=UPI0013D61D48|nr:16S rRNA (cytidine(1402)-2'-O)-methyltransferase [Pseudodesulfovibrio sp. JC047]NDV19703.1 16S rRNA (cytidine(1402)-2'-O)-methyltransferase [Pseudodesulfovibrio sp. JC047]
MTDTGTLWVIATPLGNVGDMSPRARHLLTESDVVLAEDTRRAGLLFKRLELEHHGRLVSFFEHNEDKRLPRVLELLDEGLDVALISDAGTPLLSDPGFTLVRACRDKGIRVSPVPGPSAPVVALSASGLPPLPYSFLGFPPRKKSHTEKFFKAHRETGATLVFFERKSRLKGTLSIAFEMLGDREFCVARELTKEYEEFIRGTLGSIASMDLDLRGELTVIIAPPTESGRTDEQTIVDLLEEERLDGGKPKEVARRVAERANGWTAKEVYAAMRQ